MYVPILDADNPMYETREAFTKFLPKVYKNAVRYAASSTCRSRSPLDDRLGAGCGGRIGLSGHESHDHLAVYAHNGNEYLEAMLGAFKARVAAVNVNYRYVADELRHVLADSGAEAIVYHSTSS